MDQLLASQPINYRQKYQFEYEMSVETGDFVLFPAYLRHRVLPNTTDRDRLILGVNYGSKGWYWSANWVNEFTSGPPPQA
jgi:ectoine hydroxylase-related dioxygenase (phytanoyl-CoA dioxygenase family)